MVVAQACHEVTGGIGIGDLQTLHQACPPVEFVDRGVRRYDRVQPVPEPHRARIDAIEEARLQQHIDHGTAHATGQRVAAVGGAVGAGADPFHGCAGAHEAAERKAAADALGDCDQVRVGLAVSPFVGEQASGPAHAALHFVVDQQQPEFVTDRPQSAQVVQIRRGNAAFALNGFDQNGSGFFGDRRAGLVQIVERHVVEAVDRRAEAVEVLWVVGGGDGRQRPAVKGVARADYAVLLRVAVDVVVTACGLEAALQRFSA